MASNLHHTQSFQNQTPHSPVTGKKQIDGWNCFCVFCTQPNYTPCKKDDGAYFLVSF